MPDEGIFSAFQQEDMRGLLGLVNVFLQGNEPEVFAKSEVLVSPDIAVIVVSEGLEPLTQQEQEELAKADAAGNHVARARILAKSSNARSKIVGAASKFLTELGSTGCPLFGRLENTGESVLIHFKLAPNDVLGAEKILNRLFKRLKKTKEDAIQKPIA